MKVLDKKQNLLKNWKKKYPDIIKRLQQKSLDQIKFESEWMRPFKSNFVYLLRRQTFERPTFGRPTNSMIKKRFNDQEKVKNRSEKVQSTLMLPQNTQKKSNRNREGTQ